MKITVVTGPKGELVATAQAQPEQQEVQAELVAGPGQRLHELTIPDELAEIRDPAELHTKIHAYLPKS